TISPAPPLFIPNRQACLSAMTACLKDRHGSLIRNPSQARMGNSGRKSSSAASSIHGYRQRVLVASRRLLRLRGKLALASGVVNDTDDLSHQFSKKLAQEFYPYDDSVFHITGAYNAFTSYSASDLAHIGADADSNTCPSHVGCRGT